MGKHFKVGGVAGNYWTTMRDIEKNPQDAAGELIDNCLDSKATEMHIETGKGFIRFRDNGRGMNKQHLEDMLTLGSTGQGTHEDASASARHGSGAKSAMAFFGSVYEIRSVQNNREYVVAWNTAIDIKSNQFGKGIDYRVDGKPTDQPSGTEITIKEHHGPWKAGPLADNIRMDFTPAIHAGVRIFFNGELLKPVAPLWIGDQVQVSGEVDGMRWRGTIGTTKEGPETTRLQRRFSTGVSVRRCHRYMRTLQNCSEVYPYADVYMDVHLEVANKSDWEPDKNKGGFLNRRLKWDLIESIRDAIEDFLSIKKRESERLELTGMGQSLTNAMSSAALKPGGNKGTIPGDDLEAEIARTRETGKEVTPRGKRQKKNAENARKKDRKKVKDTAGISSHSVGGFLDIKFQEPLCANGAAMSVMWNFRLRKVTVQFSTALPTMQRQSYPHALYVPVIALALWGSLQYHESEACEEFPVFREFFEELEREGIDKANPDAQGRFVAYLHEVMDQETLNSMARQSYGAAV